jgi:hypothetical protein
VDYGVMVGCIGLEIEHQHSELGLCFGKELL